MPGSVLAHVDHIAELDPDLIVRIVLGDGSIYQVVEDAGVRLLLHLDDLAHLILLFYSAQGRQQYH